MEIKSVVRKTIDSLLDLAAVIEKLDGMVPESAYFTVNLGAMSVEVWPSSEDESRKIVGNLIRAFKAKPTIRKWGNTDLEAGFMVSSVAVKVNRYRGRKCAVVKRQIIHEAVAEQIVPAKAGWVEEVEELVCEMPAVEQEVEAQVPAQAEAVAI